jgi:hypothetical protein
MDPVDWPVGMAATDENGQLTAAADQQILIRRWLITNPAGIRLGGKGTLSAINGQKVIHGHTTFGTDRDPELIVPSDMTANLCAWSHAQLKVITETRCCFPGADTIVEVVRKFTHTRVFNHALRKQAMEWRDQFIIRPAWLRSSRQWVGHGRGSSPEHPAHWCVFVRVAARAPQELEEIGAWVKSEFRHIVPPNLQDGHKIVVVEFVPSRHGPKIWLSPLGRPKHARNGHRHR